MELSAYIYHPEASILKELQRLTAAVLFNADYRATVYGAGQMQKLENIISRHASGIDILILPASDTSFALAQRLRENNRRCALVYVRGGMEEVLRAFASMPIAYLTENDDSASYAGSLLRAAAWACAGKQRFRHESRTELIQLSYGEIEYFESNYRVVHIHRVNGEISTITARLDDVQSSLPGEVFCRCHKSYLVNMQNIDRIDKSTKRVYFNSGSFVYASKALYPDLIACMSKGGDCSETV